MLCLYLLLPVEAILLLPSVIGLNPPLCGHSVHLLALGRMVLQGCLGIGACFFEQQRCPSTS
jgi:hypothetical protein